MSPFHSNMFVPKGHQSHELMMLDTTHASQPWEGGRGAPLCGPPPRQSLERGGTDVRAALAACQNGSRCCATRLGRRTRAQRHRSRRRRRTFLWGARCARGPPGLPFAEFHDDGDTCDSLYEYQCLSGYGMVPKDNDIYSSENVPFYTQRDPTLCKKRVCEPEEMQWCDDRNESRTASCQHQRVSACEGQDKIFYNMNVTANFVGLNTECTGDFGAIAGVPHSVAMTDECNSSSSNACSQECQYPSGCGTLPMDNENFTEVKATSRRPAAACTSTWSTNATQRTCHSTPGETPTLCKKRVCELEEKQWCTDRNESGTTFGQQRQGCNKCDESRGEAPTTSASTKSKIIAEGDPHVTSLPGEVSDLGKTCPQQGDLTIEEREDLLALLIAVRMTEARMHSSNWSTN